MLIGGKAEAEEKFTPKYAARMIVNLLVVLSMALLVVLYIINSTKKYVLPSAWNFRYQLPQDL